MKSKTRQLLCKPASLPRCSSNHVFCSRHGSRSVHSLQGSCPVMPLQWQTPFLLSLSMTALFCLAIKPKKTIIHPSTFELPMSHKGVRHSEFPRKIDKNGTLSSRSVFFCIGASWKDSRVPCPDQAVLTSSSSTLRKITKDGRAHFK